MISSEFQFSYFWAFIFIIWNLLFHHLFHHLPHQNLINFHYPHQIFLLHHHQLIFYFIIIKYYHSYCHLPLILFRKVNQHNHRLLTHLFLLHLLLLLLRCYLFFFFCQVLKFLLHSLYTFFLKIWTYIYLSHQIHLIIRYSLMILNSIIALFFLLIFQQN